MGFRKYATSLLAFHQFINLPSIYVSHFITCFLDSGYPISLEELPLLYRLRNRVRVGHQQQPHSSCSGLQSFRISFELNGKSKRQHTFIPIFFSVISMSRLAKNNTFHRQLSIIFWRCGPLIVPEEYGAAAVH